MTNTPPAKEANEAAANQPHFSVHHVFLRDLRLERKNPPQPKGEKPKIETQIAVNTQAIKDKANYYEGVLNLIVTCQQGDEVIYEINISQGGVFELTGFEKDAIEKAISGYGMNILYPYITQQVNTIAQQAGFGPVLLAPMNFDALYEQYQQRAAKEKEAAVEK